MGLDGVLMRNGHLGKVYYVHGPSFSSKEVVRQLIQRGTLPIVLWNFGFLPNETEDRIQSHPVPGHVDFSRSACVSIVLGPHLERIVAECS